MRHPTEHQQKAPVSDPAGPVWITHPFFIRIRDVQAPVCARLGVGGDIHLGLNTVCLKEISECDRHCSAPNRFWFLSARQHAMLPMFLNKGHHHMKTKWTEGAGKAFRLLPEVKWVWDLPAQYLACPQGWSGMHCWPWEARHFIGKEATVWWCTVWLCIQGVGRG